MADNVTVPGVGVIFATNEGTGAVQWPYAVLAVDVAGVPTPVTSAAPAPISLGAALPAGTNNIGDVDVLTVPAVASTTREYVFASGVTVTAGASTSRTASGITAAEIMLHNAGTVRAYFRTGNSAVNATVDALSIPLEPGEKFHKRITSGDYVAAIRDGASDCAIRILPVA